MIAELDKAPLFIRSSEQARKARAMALASLVLTGELLKRLRPEIEADQESKGVQDGDEK